MTAPSPPSRLVRVHEVVERTGLARTTIWRLRKAGAFPAPVRLGTQNIGWRASTIDDWIESRPDLAV